MTKPVNTVDIRTASSDGPFFHSVAGLEERSSECT